MADFIAVIRRAVSGLSNNTPEMRVKVYEKARGAVMRQLENMSPRPSDEMLRRQIDKLEAAIVEVEAEYSEALPPEDQTLIEDAAPAVLPAEPEPEPVAPAEPVAAGDWQDEAEHPQEPEAPSEPEPVEETPAYEAYSEAPDYGSEPVQDERTADEVPYEVAETPDYEPAEEAGYEAEDEAVPAEEPTWADEPVYTPTEPEHAGEVASEEPSYAGHDETTSEVAVEPEDEPWSMPAEPVYGSPETVAAETEASDQAEPEELYEAPAVAASDDRVVEEVSWAPYVPDNGQGEASVEQEGSLDDVLASGEHASAVDEEGARDEFDALVRGDGPRAEATDSLDLLKWEPTAETSVEGGAAADDSFDAWLAGGDRDASADDRQENEEDVPEEHRDNDLSSLFAGVEPVVVPSAAGADDLHRAGFSDEFPPETQTKAYRVEPARKRSFAPLVIGVVALLVVAGGGYAIWANKATVGEMVDDMMAAAPDVAPDSTEEPSDTADSAPASDTETADQSSADPVTEAPAGADSSTDGHKFTQRLLSDGTEVDPGEAPVSASDTGRSVSEQNVAAGDGGAPAQADGGAATEGTDVASAGSDAVVAGSEKALLYEERLGQATPTAIDGGIVWSRVEEQSNGRPEPAIQGRLTIPSNGLSALITIKRNTDNSLPASHLMEIVFSVPAEFEGGAIDGVQRVTMKRTEQERGEQLVAVSAKVTEDTYLVALNDFEDVVQRNLDLLHTREWIDIPVTYRNGRRALLTLDKGASGDKVFDTVIKEWNALSSSGG